MRFWRRCLLLILLWPLVSVAGGEILLTGAQDSPGVREFVEALKARRPGDTVRFIPLAELPEPARLRSDTRLILLDPEALDWRLRPPGRPRWCCASAGYRPSNAWVSGARPTSACSGAIRRWPASCT